MNKKNEKNMLIAKLVVLVLLLAVVGRIFVGGLFFTEFLFSIDDEKLAKTQQQFTNIKGIDIDSASYEVIVEEHEYEYVEIEESVKRFSKAGGNIEEKDGILSYKQKLKKKPFNYGYGVVTVRVPVGSAYSYNLNVISGSVDFNANSQELDVSTVSGEIRVKGTGEEVAVSSVSGNVQVHPSFTEASVETVSGSVDLATGTETKSVQVETISGNVCISVPENTGYKMDYITASGSVRDGYAGERYGKKGEVSYGDGSIEIEVSTVSGAIELEDWE